MNVIRTATKATAAAVTAVALAGVFAGTAHAGDPSQWGRSSVAGDPSQWGQVATAADGDDTPGLTRKVNEYEGQHR
jgi:hypothetical protein